MKAPSKQILIAARARAAGNSWKATAELVGRTIAVVRQWPDRYPNEWKRCFQQAQQETQHEAEAEAVAKLRTQLRDETGTAGGAAAKTILAWAKRVTGPKQKVKMSDRDKSDQQFDAMSDMVKGELANSIDATAESENIS